MELLDFLSGLLLTLVVVGILVYTVKEIATDRVGGSRKILDYVATALARYVGREAKPVNDHLIGSIGKVIAHSDDGDRPMRVRVGPEYWHARLGLSEEGRLPINAAVKVAAVDGSILVVEAGPDQRGSRF